jgi:hypothetical protein
MSSKCRSPLAETLTVEFDRGFDVSNLRYTRLFPQAFPNCDALRHQLSRTCHRPNHLQTQSRKPVSR